MGVEHSKISRYHEFFNELVKTQLLKLLECKMLLKSFNSCFFTGEAKRSLGLLYYLKSLLHACPQFPSRAGEYLLILNMDNT
jgi:hypothetical protein